MPPAVMLRHVTLLHVMHLHAIRPHAIPRLATHRHAMHRHNYWLKTFTGLGDLKGSPFLFSPSTAPVHFNTSG
ncbi:hypothetical protein ACFL2O_04265 [Thermodesulfobacteriota bacterium]